MKVYFCVGREVGKVMEVVSSCRHRRVSEEENDDCSEHYPAFMNMMMMGIEAERSNYSSFHRIRTSKSDHNNILESEDEEEETLQVPPPFFDFLGVGAT